MSDSYTEMDYWDWFDEYKPISNHLDKNASADGYLFMNYGKEWEYVSNVNTNNIWSLIITDREDDTSSWEIINGIRVVNREGYFITEIPYLKESLLLINS